MPVGQEIDVMQIVRLRGCGSVVMFEPPVPDRLLVLRNMIIDHHRARGALYFMEQWTSMNPSLRVSRRWPYIAIRPPLPDVLAGIRRPSMLHEICGGVLCLHRTDELVGWRVTDNPFWMRMSTACPGYR